jgi:F0F1-type ATP synthase membrane subunit c/vacuolar-type H+-ATPase subunit K
MAKDSVGLETAYRIAAIICGAMAASTVLYALVVAVISVSQAPFEGFAPSTQPSILRTTLWTLALVEAGLIGLARRALVARSRSEGAAAQGRRLITTAVVTAALAEVPAILGLVLFMLAGLRGDFYALLALSLALQAVYFPRLDGWRQWAAEPASGS